MSISFDAELGRQMRESAGAAGQTVSAWLAEAARDRLRLEALRRARRPWEQRHGALTGEDLDQARALLAGPPVATPGTGAA
jgi:DNA-binding IclR family transcriptional regulator